MKKKAKSSKEAKLIKLPQQHSVNLLKDLLEDLEATSKSIEEHLQEELKKE